MCRRWFPQGETSPPFWFELKAFERSSRQTETLEVKVQNSKQKRCKKVRFEALFGLALSDPPALCNHSPEVGHFRPCTDILRSRLGNFSALLNAPSAFRRAFRRAPPQTAGNHPQSWGLISAETPLLPHFPSERRTIGRAKISILRCFSYVFGSYPPVPTTGGHHSSLRSK